MDDCFHATRDALIRTILTQRDVIAEQERRLADQDRQLHELPELVAQLSTHLGQAASSGVSDSPPPPGSPQRMPGHKPTQVTEQPARPRQRRAHGAGRRRVEATRQETHALAVCPDCGAPLAGGSVKRTRQVIDLPAPRIEVIEHVYLERRCPDSI